MFRVRPSVLIVTAFTTSRCRLSKIPDSPGMVGTESRAKCHEVCTDAEFGVAAGVSSYQASYHGLPSKLGSK